jgi:hypothetical protein
MPEKGTETYIFFEPPAAHKGALDLECVFLRAIPWICKYQGYGFISRESVALNLDKRMLCQHAHVTGLPCNGSRMA